MKVPIFRAKDKDSDKMVEGFYFNYPITDSANDIDINSYAHCIITYQKGLMGIINEPIACSIELESLEFVKFVDVPVREDISKIILT